jgi:hypothetical protein
MYSACLRGLILASSLAACTSGPGRSDAGGNRLADREAIEAALERYTRGPDRLDPEPYFSSFAPNGVLMIHETPHQGQDALQKIDGKWLITRREIRAQP